MASFHERQLTFELKRLQKRLEHPKIKIAIQQNPSFAVQRQSRKLVEQLQERVEYVLHQVETRHSFLGRVKKILVGEGDFDSKVGALETETEKLFKRWGVEGI
ncbi:hypothetical protein EG329_014380 [Mollisiaceae sp. DMI_Dod_QoI]|nr:hypothetical protein EG329_014380 [Helotiales sp. DMI_Dod_QoI]